jgi:hypothetical protein
MGTKRGMQLLYVGDVGTIVPKSTIHTIDDDIDLDSMSDRQLFNLALESGIPLKTLIGIDHCYEHTDMVFLGGKVLPTGFSYYENVKYCCNCFQMFRTRRK